MTVETPAARLVSARESLGLDQSEVAGRIGINFCWYADLEMHDDDLGMTLSLEQLCNLAGILRTDPLRLLIGDRAASIERTLQFGEIVQRLTDRMGTPNLDVEAFGERVGWDLTKIMADPDELWDFNADGFRDVTAAAGLDWMSACPRTPRM